MSDNADDDLVVISLTALINAKELIFDVYTPKRNQERDLHNLLA